MKAWRIYEKGDLRCDELDSQPVGENCVKLKMLASAISLTDTMLFDGQLPLHCSPMIIGRQGVGLVTEVGAGVTGFKRGDRVAVAPYACCNNCPPCKAGHTSDCEKLLTFGVEDNGFMCDFAVVGADNLYTLPDRVKDTDAVFLEHIAMAINTLTRLDIEKGEHLVIVGSNVIGLIMAQVAMYYQAVPILVDTRQDRLDMAEQLGICYTINSVDADPQKKIFSMTGGHMADAVAFVTTSKMSLLRSLDYTAKGGRVAIVGWADSKADLNASFSSVFTKQLTVTGVNNGAKNIPSAINMLANKTVDVKSMASKEISFAEVGDYVREAVEMPNKYMKIIVKM